MNEILVILNAEAAPKTVNSVIDKINEQGGKLMLRYPPQVLIAQGDEGLVTALQAMDGIRGVFTSPIENLANYGLSEANLLAVSAWNLRNSEEYQAEKSLRADDGMSWDFHDQAPGSDIVPVDDSETPSPFGLDAQAPVSPPTNTSSYMIGTVAVGLIIVNGPAGTAAELTATERARVVAEAQEGANGLVNLSPAGAHLNFVFDVREVTLALNPTVVTGEGDWRDTAMAAIGYAAGSPGMYTYLNDLRTTHWPTMDPGPDWAYIAFFTKYAAFWFGYASLGGPRLVMQYACDGWGPNQIDRVFAHETGHIFGAGDEYGQCNAGGTFGYLQVTNNNCEYNNPASIPCIMRANTYNTCQWTVGQFGWRDSDGDGVPDPIDLTPGTYATDVGISPGSPFYNNADLWIRNQDDGASNHNHEAPESNIDNYIYSLIHNFGTVKAEITRVQYYLANFTGTEFVFPNDYTNLINAPDTPSPVIFGLMPGDTAISKVHLRATQIPPSTWHPCLLVHVSSWQDQPVAPGAHVWDTNNLAQKNLVVEYIAPSETITLPFMLQSITSEQPIFELKRIAAHPALKVQMEFPDRRIQPKIEMPTRQPALQPAFYEDCERIFFPVNTNRLVTRFRLPVGRDSRKIAGISFTAPAFARPGDSYQFELVQYNDSAQPVGGIQFMLYVTNRPLKLEKYKKRVAVLRQLALRTGNGRFGDLADTADDLIGRHLVNGKAGPGSLTTARNNWLRVVRELTAANAFSYPPARLEAMAMSAGRRPSISADLNALSALLYYGQESLLADHVR